MKPAPVPAELVDRCADPARVRAALARLEEADADLPSRLETAGSAAALVAVLAASRSLGRLLVREPEGLALLVPGAPRQPVPLGAPADLPRWKQRELLRIAGRDLTGGGLEDTMVDLSAMAVDVLSAARTWAGEGLADDDRLSVIAMGKLGAQELNYSSDVDLVLVGEGDPSRVERAARRLLELAGTALRVDVDLRPEGRDGPLVRTVESYVSYWTRWAAPWERQALVKARPVAGDRSLGEAWAEAAAHATWERPFGAEDLRFVRRLKERAEEEVRRRGLADRDVKRGVGGIRDIEFAAQLLQLVHGRVDVSLRERATLAALQRLAHGGYVDADDAAGLAGAYRFLRRVEHAVQLDEDRQTHVVPEDREARRRLARVVGFRGTPAAGPTDAFDRELVAQRGRVRVTYERVWFRPLLASLSGAGPLGELATAERLAAFGFADADRTRQAVAELTRGLTRSSRMMEQLLPLLLDWLSISPDPDLGLLGLRRLASGEGRSRALAIAFRDSPEVARRLALLLGTSRLLGDVLVANPDLLVRLPDPARLRTRPADELVDSALRAISWRADLEERQRALHRWKQRHLFGVAARDVLGEADLAQVGTDLTGLADASLEVALRSVDPKVPFAIVALGRLGGGEVGYASDLDVAFVHEGDDAEEAERVASTLLRFVGGATPAERVWSVDPDLRPEGRSGPLSRSLLAWEAYLARWASAWERQAYLRIRPVAGDRGLAERLVGLVRASLDAVPLRPADELELRRLKVRMDRERLAPGEDPAFHLKLGPGSLSDVEFTVHLLQRRHGVPAASISAALDVLVAAGHLEGDEAAALAESHRFCEAVRNRAFLVAGPGDSLPTRPELITPLARSLGATVPELRDEFRRVTRRARRVVERRFYGHG